MQAAEDFMQIVLEAHIVTAAEEEMTDGVKVKEVAERIVEKYIKLAPGHGSNDFIHVYACEVLTLGLIWLNYYDAIKEGDGERIMKIWKYLLLIFKKAGRTNYSKEAAVLLINFHFTTSERVAAEIMTSRFINTKGRAGCNKPCDLHLEHLNRRLKGVISHLESNIQPSTLIRAAKAIGIIDRICTLFNEKVGGTEDSDHHSKPSSYKDFSLICESLKEIQVFRQLPSRKHKFITIKECLLESVKVEDIADWIIDRIIPSFF
jgi:L1 cell adhesion molecule like protein